MSVPVIIDRLTQDREAAVARIAALETQKVAMERRLRALEITVATLEAERSAREQAWSVADPHIANSRDHILNYIRAEGEANATDREIELERILAQYKVDAVQKRIDATQAAFAAYAPDVSSIVAQFDRMHVNPLERAADRLTLHNDMRSVRTFDTATIEEYMRRTGQQNPNP